MSSTSPTRNKNAAPPKTTSDSFVDGTNRRQVAVVATNIATPPSIAVGFLCQRSDFGFATKPDRNAKLRTRRVIMKPSTKLKPTKTSGFADNWNMLLFSQRSKKDYFPKSAINSRYKDLMSFTKRSFE